MKKKNHILTTCFNIIEYIYQLFFIRNRHTKKSNTLQYWQGGKFSSKNEREVST